MSQTTEPSSDQQPETSKGARSFPEKVSFGISLGILAAVVGLVVYVWVSKESDRPPELAIQQTETIRQTNGQFYVPFSVTNTGGNTAEAIRVMAELQIQGEVIESGEQEFDFLSGNETEEGAFVFTQDPRLGDLRLRVTGYRLP